MLKSIFVSEEHIASVHDGKKLFECKICNVKFKTKYYSIKHIETIHKGLKPLIWWIYKTRFGQKGQTKTHNDESIYEDVN